MNLLTLERGRGINLDSVFDWQYDASNGKPILLFWSITGHMASINGPAATRAWEWLKDHQADEGTRVERLDAITARLMEIEVRVDRLCDDDNESLAERL